MFFPFRKSQEKQKSHSGHLAKGLVIGFFSVVAFATILISGFISYGKADSAASTTTPVPQFNFLPGDSEMLTGTKYNSGTGWVDPVPSVNLGDEVAVAFYVHNGVAGSVAHSTYVRVDLTGTLSNTPAMASHLWSQETEDITNTVVNGSTVGRTGLTINLANGVQGRAEYVAGTTRSFKNSNGQFVFDKNLPDGITQNSGLNLGDINGCWQYAKLITFRVKVRGVTSFLMDKQVRVEPSTTWLQSTQAWAGNTVDYRVAIENTGTETATVVLKDVKPDYMTYQAGTTYYYDYLHSSGVQLGETLFSTAGITLTNVPVDDPSTTGQDEGVVYVTYKLKIDSTLPTTCGVGLALNNVAQLFLAGTQIFTDTAGVVTKCETRDLGFLKQVKTGATTWGKTSTATLGSTVDYKLTIKNNGNVNMTNVKVRDVVPQYSDYVIGSTKVDGTTVGDAVVTTSGLNLGTLTPTQQKIVTLQVTVYGCVPIGNYTLTNTAYGWADNVSQLSDSTTTTVAVSAPIAQ